MDTATTVETESATAKIIQQKIASKGIVCNSFTTIKNRNPEITGSISLNRSISMPFFIFLTNFPKINHLVNKKKCLNELFFFF